MTIRSSHRRSRRLRRPVLSRLAATLVAAGAGVVLAFAGSAAWSAGADGDAAAKAGYDSPYGYERTWNSAVRYVRVDMGLKVTEKDQGGGYLMFEYRSPESGAKPSPGSIEVVRPDDADKPVRVLVQLPQMPHYHEQVFVDGFSQKLRTEYGEPPAPKPKAAPPPVVDAGADAEAP